MVGGPFEPSDETSSKARTWKTNFFLAITSVARVRELQTPDSHPGLPRRYKHKTVLRLNPFFLAKVPTQQHLNREIELEALYPHSKNKYMKAMLILCLVCAFKIYLSKTKDIRKANKLLVS